jgi:hypothetical protein
MKTYIYIILYSILYALLRLFFITEILYTQIHKLISTHIKLQDVITFLNQAFSGPTTVVHNVQIYNIFGSLMYLYRKLTNGNISAKNWPILMIQTSINIRNLYRFLNMLLIF